jgi:dodecin
MNEPTYKKIEVVGTSDVSIEGAVNNAIAVTEKTIRNLRWFEIGEIRGSIENGQVNQWQVGLKLAFTIDAQNPGSTGNLVGRS